MLFFERAGNHCFFRTKLLLLGACALVLYASESRAFTGHLGVESWFMRDEVQPSTFPIVHAGVSDQSSSDDTRHEYKLDADFKISPTHPKAYTLSSRNLYWGDREDNTETPLRFSFGRKLVGWSDIDELWGVGAFEPLDSWDRLRPFTQGLTGVFAFTQTQDFDFRFFASYLFIPELTPNVVVENNHFSYEHPQSITTAPQTINVAPGRPAPTLYSLELPSLAKIVFRPSVALMIATRPENPFYAKVSMGYLPLNYLPVELSGYLTGSNTVPVTIYPRLLSHSIVSGDVGYRFRSSWTPGISATVDSPEGETIPTLMTATPLSTSWTIAPWLKYNWAKTTLILTQIWTTGGLENDVGAAANTNGVSLFSSRILYRKATQLSIRQTLWTEKSCSASLFLKGVHEYAINANWISGDIVVAPEPSLQFYAGADLISAEKNAAPDHGAEFLSDMKAIDRIRLGATYAF